MERPRVSASPICLSRESNAELSEVDRKNSVLEAAAIGVSSTQNGELVDVPVSQGPPRLCGVAMNPVFSGVLLGLGQTLDDDVSMPCGRNLHGGGTTNTPPTGVEETLDEIEYVSPRIGALQAACAFQAIDSTLHGVTMADAAPGQLPARLLQLIAPVGVGQASRCCGNILMTATGVDDELGVGVSA